MRSDTTLGDSLVALLGQFVLRVAFTLLIHGFAAIAMRGRSSIH